MKVIGFSINKILAEKKNPLKGKLEIKNSFVITDISKTEVSLLKQDTLKFDFDYTMDYAPNLGEIKILGSLIGLDDKGEADSILKSWKDKKFVGESKVAILNYIIEECHLRSLNIEKELGLPFHSPFPKFSAVKQEQKKETKDSANYAG